MYSKEFKLFRRIIQTDEALSGTKGETCDSREHKWPHGSLPKHDRHHELLRREQRILQGLLQEAINSIFTQTSIVYNKLMIAQWDEGIYLCRSGHICRGLNAAVQSQVVDGQRERDRAIGQPADREERCWAAACHT